MLLKFDVLVASFFINLLALAVPIYVIQALTRFLANGIYETLYALTFGVLIAIILELLFKHYRKNSILNLYNSSNPTKNYFHKISKINFENAKLNQLENLPQKIKYIREQESQFNLNMIQNIYDLPYVIIFLFVIFLLSPLIFTILIAISIFGLLLRILHLNFEAKANRNYLNSKQKNEYLEYELIKNFSNIHLFSSLKKFFNDLSIKQTNISKLEAIKNSQLVSWSLIQNFLSTILIVFVVFTSVIEIYRGDLQIASMIALNILTIRTFIPISSIPNILSYLFKKNSNDLEQLSNISPVNQKQTTLKIFEGEVELKEIYQKFPSQKTSLYENFSFKFKKGSTTVVTGKNGTGKTTLFKLITGLINPTEGKILIDRVNLEQIDRDWLRKQFIAVPQEPTFFEGTIASNLFNSIEEPSEENVSNAVKISGLDEILADHDEGINAKIKFLNTEFSLGIRKRIALARALLNDGKFVIFDEPTEGLDIDGANIFYNFLNNCISSDKTVVVLSHDPAIIKGADTIINLNNRPTPQISSGPRSYKNTKE